MSLNYSLFTNPLKVYRINFPSYMRKYIKNNVSSFLITFWDLTHFFPFAHSPYFAFTPIFEQLFIS